MSAIRTSVFSAMLLFALACASSPTRSGGPPPAELEAAPIGTTEGAALADGPAAPGGVVIGTDGAKQDLSEHYATTPAVIVFYRGDW